jgi:hypothetical protein
MLPILLGLGGFYYLYHRHRKTGRPSKPIPPAVMAAHGSLMQNEYQPERLEHAARAFGAEGFQTLSRELSGKARQVRQQAAVVPDLVVRSRAGDQNALAHITRCRENAALGNARAAVTCMLIEQYCHAHPAPPRPGEAQSNTPAQPASQEAAA